MSDSPTIYSDAHVCVDCYFAHHYGITAMVRDKAGLLWGPFTEADRDDMQGTAFVWFAGESDEPADREPLVLLGALTLSDNTDSESGDGIDGFSSSPCDGCGSMLGGARYRLAVWGA